MNLPNLPQHVAIIMDGNGRWAELRKRDRTLGHLKGARVAKNIIQSCVELGVQQLTLYAFSTENWKRPAPEINVLFKLLKKFLLKEEIFLSKDD